MRNTLAIAQKELRAYFVSPMGYFLVGFFALLYGYFFAVSLQYLLSISLQAGMFGGQAINMNELMIRPLFGNTGVILLFFLPLITARAYTEERRSGTMELLLSSPLTNVQVILGKFLGAMALLAAMLAITGIHTAFLFWYGEPELGPILSGYLGLLLMGGTFIAIGLLVSSATRHQMVAGGVTFAILLLFWVVSWMGDPNTGSVTSEVLSHLSILDHFDDFSKGVIDTAHLTYYVSFIAFGLFLTAKSVDSERWRG